VTQRHWNTQGAVYKGRPQSGGSFSSADILRTRGRCSSNSDFHTPHFLARKNPDFSKFKVYPHGQRGRGESGKTIFGQGGGGSIFREFVRTSFMDSPNKKYKNTDRGADKKAILLLHKSSKINQ